MKFLLLDITGALNKDSITFTPRIAQRSNVPFAGYESTSANILREHSQSGPLFTVYIVTTGSQNHLLLKGFKFFLVRKIFNLFYKFFFCEVLPIVFILKI